ncbi:MAG: hypothetical protein ACO31I_16880, partial [Prochlorotrichaceae cyanobacterium]
LITTVVGTSKILGNDIPSLFISILFSALIGGALYFSYEIHSLEDPGFPQAIKPLWWLSFLYDLGTSFFGNRRFIIQTNFELSEWPKILILLGLTLFVSSCPVILSYLRNNVDFMTMNNSVVRNRRNR